jgi:hypothetical protein
MHFFLILSLILLISLTLGQPAAFIKLCLQVQNKCNISAYHKKVCQCKKKNSFFRSTTVFKIKPHFSCAFSHWPAQTTLEIVFFMGKEYYANLKAEIKRFCFKQMNSDPN